MQIVNIVHDTSTVQSILLKHSNNKISDLDVFVSFTDILLLQRMVQYTSAHALTMSNIWIPMRAIQ